VAGATALGLGNTS